MFNKLSLELVDLIVVELDWSDLLTLRYVCRYLWQATYAQIAKARFATLDIDFSLRCLCRLANLGRHNGLASAVRCLRIKTHWELPLGDGHLWPRLQNGCLDLAAQPTADFRTSLIRFTRCTKISIIDEIGLSNTLDDSGGTDAAVTILDACHIMFSLLGKLEGPRIREFEADFGSSLDYASSEYLLEC